MKIFNEPVKNIKKRYNKNKKKAWRKKIDISDVEGFLEDKRREERLGGPLGEKKSEEIFCIDNGPVEVKEKTEIDERLSKIEKKITDFKVYVPKKNIKPLKCHEFINGLPGAKAISKKGGIMKQRENKVIKRAKKGKLTTQLKKKTKTGGQEELTDVWNAKNNELDQYDEVAKSYMKDALSHIKERIRANKVRIPASISKKPSLLPAVRPPKGGASYNPSFEDHQELLSDALKLEVAKKIMKERDERMIKRYLPKGGITEEEHMKEMSEGLPIANASQFEEEPESISDEASDVVCNRGKHDKKTIQKRKKEKTLKVREQLRLQKKKRKKLESGVFQVKTYEKEIEGEEQKLKKIQKKKAQEKKLNQYKTKKLSRYTFEEEDVMVPLGNELLGSVRKIQPLGIAIDGCYKNLQRRNVIETKVRVKKQKAMTKPVKKRVHKEEEENFIKSLMKRPESVKLKYKKQQ